MMKIVFILALLAPWTPTIAAYTMADLEVLTQEENFEEYFKHALDIRPSERKDAWKAMTSKMAEGLSKQILSKSEITKQHFLKIESLYKWPSLKSDDVFKLNRQEIGLRFIKSCFKTEASCWGEIKSFWESDLQDSETSFKLAELTLNAKEPTITTWSFLEGPLKGSLSEFYCRKDFVLKAIWGKFEIDYIRLGTSGDLLKKIDETLHPDCLISFNKWIQTMLLSPEKTSDRELAYQLLAAQGKTNDQTTDFFYTIYLLENPSKGDLFNYAWNRLSELSKSATRRESVIDRMKTLDPLPDEVFSSLDQTKKRAIINHFKANFPEYLNYYANQCLAFYEGKTNFPNGNPTIKCQSLMDLEDMTSILGEDKIKRFQKAHSL